MVEHTVENDSYTKFVKGIAYPLEALVVAESAVYLSVVDGIISVLAALENRIEYDTVYSHLFEMRYEIINLIQTVLLIEVVVLGSAAETERIYVVYHRVIYPMHMFYLLLIEFVILNFYTSHSSGRVNS